MEATGTQRLSPTVSSQPVVLQCAVCSDHATFKTRMELGRHLRERHCAKEGGSFVCRYGANGVCPTLPLEGVSDKDYVDHVVKEHLSRDGAISTLQRSSSQTSPSPSPSASEPSVVTDQQKWTVYNSQVNLAAVLNDPRRSRREHDFFTKTWGEDFIEIGPEDIHPSFYLPNITKAHFEHYLKSARHRYAVHQQNKHKLPTNSPPSAQTLAPLPRHLDKGKADLEQVPKIFMQPNFALENPATFNTVLPWSQFEPPKDKEQGRQSSKLLQEKLSHYLDIVEVQIARQISYRSEAFFSAMASHDELQDNMTHCLSAIKQLRDRIHNIDSVLAKGSLQLLQLSRSRQNYTKLYHMMKMMATVHQTQPMVQVLLSTSDFVAALDLISITQQVLAKDLAGIQSFRHLGLQLCELERVIDRMMQEDFQRYAVENLARPKEDGIQLFEEERLTSLVYGLLRQHRFEFLEVMREEAATAIKAGIKQTVAEFVSQVDTIDNESVGSLADQMRMLNFQQWLAMLGEVFTKLLLLVSRVKMTAAVIQGVIHLAAGRGHCTTEVGVALGVSKASRPVSTSTSQSSKPEAEAPDDNGPLENSHEEFVSEENRVLGFHDDHVLTNGDIAALSNSEELRTKERESRSSVDRTAENSEEKAQQNGVDRTEQHSELTANDVAGTTRDDLTENCSGSVDDEDGEDVGYYLEDSEHTVYLSETDYVKVSVTLKDLLCFLCDHAHDRCLKLLMARSKDGFLERLTSSEFVQLSRAIEGFVKDCEQVCGRRSTSLRGGLQSQANRFVNRFHEERKTKLSLILDSERWKQTDVPVEFQDLVNSVDKVTEKKPTEYLVVDGQKFAVVGTVLLLLKMVLEYCQCADDLPSATPDILTRLVELLKHFNSRSCQLVLGAGARQVVGLKTITTKNLALCSRCLQLMVHHLPIVEEHFRARLQHKQQPMLKSFQQVIKDYNDHIQEIASKLIAIMDDMFEKSLAKWEAKAPMPSSTFRTICKQISKLHEAIVDLLPPEQIRVLFTRINVSFKSHLQQQLVRLNVTNDGGPQHGLVQSDVAFYSGHMQSLRDLTDVDLHMQDIWDR
ncbi:vacuolar protein sorting-associated protein 54-like isoform X2 [Branchiostoma floridae]|uniref:Vacuolar protein sorting-associated protein 54 n=1 Tax=Branchiostoma floridae TaxID=7739 RepID=A0A9J7LDP0_BRAFL|nr:vacuolar protein sorting-associated protein 54-like isoform X2 [Branchiostoma floridae]